MSEDDRYALKWLAVGGLLLLNVVLLAAAWVVLIVRTVNG